MKKGTAKHNQDKVILNQPITSEENDWIGVGTYVDKLEEAVRAGARLIGVISDFGSGKSSLVALYKNRKKHNPFRKILTINMWEAIAEEKGQKRQSGQRGQGGAQEDLGDWAEKKDGTLMRLHKTFIFHAINQLNPVKGSYVSRRLSRNYGLFEIRSGSTLQSIFLAFAVVLFVMAEGIRRFKEQIGAMLGLAEVQLDAGMYIFYAVGLICMFYLALKADFLFSSAQSEGKREPDENILIDYFNREVLYRGFFRHYVFVIEDLDRTDDKETVICFLKELRKYYLTDQNWKSNMHHNKITFIINIKPEAKLHDGSKRGREKDELYTKFFDYMIDLKKINMDNYDVILNGLLKEHKSRLCGLKLLQETDEVCIENIPGMQWMIRGRHLGIREIKNRLDNALTLYESLTGKFPDRGITFEKCAVVSYLTTEFADDFYDLGDYAFESIVSKYISGSLDENPESWGVEWTNTNFRFRMELLSLVKSRLIDVNYRTYFYNYPKESKLYSISESVVYNSIVYGETPKNSGEFTEHLRLTKEDVLEDAYGKVKQLGMIFPRFTLEYEKLLGYVLWNFPDKAAEVVQELGYGAAQKNQTTNYILGMLRFGNMEEEQDRLAEIIAEAISEKAENPDAVLEFRQKICRQNPDKIGQFHLLYENDNRFITAEEVRQIGNLQQIMPLLNFSTSEIDGFIAAGNLPDGAAAVHLLILQDAKAEYCPFYGKLAELFGLGLIVAHICEFCKRLGEIPDEIVDLLVQGVQDGSIEAEKYVGLLSGVSRISQKAVEACTLIGWYKGLNREICGKLLEYGDVISYICNTISAGDAIEDYTDERIVEAVRGNNEWLRKNQPAVWRKIRAAILCTSRLIQTYDIMFQADAPRLDEAELMRVPNCECLIGILEENGLAPEEIPGVAAYFNRRYRNSTECYNILKFVAGLPKAFAEELFFALDLKTVSYSAMSAARKKEINALLTELLEVEKTPESILDYMAHIGVMLPELEKKLIEPMKTDEALCRAYVDAVNKLAKIDRHTVRVVAGLASIYQYSDMVNQKLYEAGYYKVYVSSKAACMKRFEMEQDKMDTMWKIYVDMFHENSAYQRTKEYMEADGEFLDTLVERKEYENAGERLYAYRKARQTKDLIAYVQKNMAEKDLLAYFREIPGFKDYAAARRFVALMQENDILGADGQIFENCHDKLVDSGEYSGFRVPAVRR